jgi:hypothetical protein
MLLPCWGGSPGNHTVCRFVRRGVAKAMAEERAAQQLYSEQKIVEILDALIDAARQAADAPRILDTYRAEHKRPTTPEAKVFADTNSLMEYGNALAKYEQELNHVVIEQTNSENRLAEQEGKVRAILPLDSNVSHT